MRIARVDIENFRRIRSASIELEPATFLVGPNNTGKSSVIAAIEALLSLGTKSLDQSDIFEDREGSRADRVAVTGVVADVPAEIAASRGFKGRVIGGEFIYRKSLSLDTTSTLIECQEYPYSVMSEFAGAKTQGDLLERGLPSQVIAEVLGSVDATKKLSKGWERSFPEVLDFDTDAEPQWVKNPGGIAPNVLSRLPKLIHVPAKTDAKDVETGVLQDCLTLLFEDLIADNPLAEDIQKNLAELEKQMDPTDEGSLICQLLSDVNKIVAEVFPDCGVAVEPSLQDLLQVLKPKYDVSVYSNVQTGAERQGTGLVRTCVFAMLRYHARLRILKDLQTRPLIVAFEEPELYLHPAAANMLRDTIYSLGRSDQILCSTHSPWMIDLRQDPQSLTRMYIGDEDSAAALNYGVSSVLGKLPQDDRQRVKMLQIFDDELSRVFFADEVVVVEGDSELLALRATMSLLPAESRKAIEARFHIAKARGKASIISLVKYLKDLGMTVRVMHDADAKKEGASKFNAPIATALAGCVPPVVLDDNLEEVLGYAPPSFDKPFKAYEHVKSWASLTDVPVRWREAMTALFDLTWPPAGP